MNTDEISKILVECAEKYILPRYKALKDHEIRTKTGPNDLVTQADLDVEEHLTKVLPGLYPGSVVVGEEAVSSGRTPMELVNSNQPLWVVDPVDGTHNFVHGGRQFGVMLALVVKGVTQAGWIYDVLGREMTVAQRGQGAFMGGKKLKVSEGITELSDLSGFMSMRFFPEKYHAAMKEAQKGVKRADPLFCAAHEYLDIARGERQFALYTRLKPWDHLAGVLITDEAGGYTAKWDGTPYKPGDYNEKGMLVASSRETWEIIFNHFIKKFI